MRFRALVMVTAPVFTRVGSLPPFNPRKAPGCPRHPGLVTYG